MQIENQSNRFHDRLRTLRERRGLSARKVAQEIGVPISTYREWENGRAVQGAHPYADLAKVLEVSLHELLTGEVPASKQKALEHLEIANRAFEQLRLALMALE